MTKERCCKDWVKFSLGDLTCLQGSAILVEGLGLAVDQDSKGLSISEVVEDSDGHQL